MKTSTDIFTVLKHEVGSAVARFGLIEEGDRIAVAVSGGKDSYSLLFILDALRRRAPVGFSLQALHLNPGFPDFHSEILVDFLAAHGFPVHVVRENHDRIIQDHLSPDSSPCSFCARLRRGTLYSESIKLGCNKLALGHHGDDFIETLLLNLFYEGSIKAMSPRLLADNKKITVIRPLVLAREEQIKQFARERMFPLIFGCCAAAEKESKRKFVKNLIHDLQKEIPSLSSNMLRSLQHVYPRHLMDSSLL